jgi:purine-nucleoside phosphorylase
MNITIKVMDEIADVIRSKSNLVPRIGLILGSGMGKLAEAIKDPIIINFNELPYWPPTTVEGHAGKLYIGELESQPTILMQGRVHYYEGYDMAQVTLPVRVMQRLGIEILLVTNAAGAINSEFNPGDVMLIKDHLNLPGMVGINPLIGPNIDELGPRFPDMSQAYDRKLCDLARNVAKERKLILREGVYVNLSGPSFESPADIRFLKNAGADAVGMSTVPEVIVARHGDTRVLGFSGISNKANLDGNSITTHEEVIAAGKVIIPKLQDLILGVLQAV